MNPPHIQYALAFLAGTAPHAVPEQVSGTVSSVLLAGVVVMLLRLRDAVKRIEHKCAIRHGGQDG